MVKTTVIFNNIWKKKVENNIASEYKFLAMLK
jgi:hypothetical protein